MNQSSRRWEDRQKEKSSPLVPERTCCDTLSDRVRCSSQCENIRTVVTHRAVNWWADVSSVVSVVNLIFDMDNYFFIYMLQFRFTPSGSGQ
jgi:hypothetical protein